jgi:zinc protease
MTLDRKIKPVAESEINFSLPEIEEFTLGNGLKVTYVHKANLPIVQMYFTINSGSKYDPENKSGLAYLTSLLIDEGAGGLNTMELDKEIEKLGSIFNISTDNDCVFISLTCIEEHFSRTMELGAKILTEPHFYQEDFEREKNRHITKIVQSLDDPSYVASTCFSNLLLSRTKYSRSTLGRSATVEQLTNEDVCSFYENHVAPDNINLVVVGSINRQKLSDELNRYFSKWKSKQILHADNNISTVPTSKRVVFIRKDNAAQSEIRIGHLSNQRSSPDYFAATIMNTILGGQFASRINSNLREDKGYTYGANSYFSYNKAAGKFLVSTAVNSENTIDAVQEVLKELDGIRKEIKKDELELAKSYLIKRYPSNFETYGQIAKNISLINYFDLPKDYFNTYIQFMSEQTLQNVTEAAVNNIFPDQLTILILGSEKLLDEKLNMLGDEFIQLDNEGNRIDD